MNVKEYVGVHRWSTYMILVGAVPVAILMHHSIFSMFGIVAVVCWQFITREVARFEISDRPMEWRAVGISAALLVLVLMVMTRVTWVAL